MRLLNALTAVLIVLKLMGLIAVSWWIVFAPTLLYILIIIVVFVIAIYGTHKGWNFRDK